jgi:outer membrane biogenesis lipoprotein LolB
MKKRFSIWLLPVTATILFSCTKLGEHPQGSLTQQNFYQTQSDAVAAVTAVYSTLTTDINNDFPVYGVTSI